MFCKNCGFNNVEGVNVCGACGNSLSAFTTAPVQDAYQASVQEPVQTPAQESVYTPVQVSPVYQPVNAQPVADDTTVSFGDWFLSIFLMRIPVVNLIISLVFAFSSNTKKSKSNFFKANLVWIAISTVFSILLGIFMATVGYAFIEELMWDYMW